ncbi:MAG TPA: S-methyl-5-thioribose-1-phosphate isomerase [Dehalococcoidales bacterium]|nr:S-methyl-5-thioribose-1-phosphate isomerase [Dehalococcoidales bacterium]
MRLNKSMDNLPIEWLGDHVRIIDQTQLPRKEVYLELDDYTEIAAAIRELKIRGAPAIGIAGAYAVALGALKISPTDKSDFLRLLRGVIDTVAATRPTARNLFFALERMRKVAEAGKSVLKIREALVEEAVCIHGEEADATMHLSLFGTELLQEGGTVLTHCNTGPLATSGYGTALGIVIQAHRQGKNISVLVDETRPLLQGARLTTWELMRAGVPVTLITDAMAGWFMRKGKVDCVITGADRIAANGDTANKIGTYTLAVLARENKIPFYVAAPTSTIDAALKTGDEIPIEERKPEEVTHVRGVPIAPEGVAAANPAFDVTPHEYITAIITEKGIIREPYGEGIRGIL